MCDECYCGGSSWTGTVNTIAAIDLFTAAIQVTFETASFGVLSGILVPFNSTPEMKLNCTGSKSEIQNEECPWLYEFAGFEDNQYIHLDFDTFVVGLFIILIFGGFAVEGYLFSTLRRGVNEKIFKECKKWLIFRTLILLFVTVGSFLKYWTKIYYLPLDGLLDFFKVYRIISLVIVYRFMNELASTVGVIYFKVPKRPKRGSL